MKTSSCEALKSSTIFSYQAFSGVVKTLPQNSTVVRPSAAGSSARWPGVPLPHAARPAMPVVAAAAERKLLRFMMLLLVIGDLAVWGARAVGVAAHVERELEGRHVCVRSLVIDYASR